MKRIIAVILAILGLGASVSTWAEGAVLFEVAIRFEGRDTCIWFELTPAGKKTFRDYETISLRADFMAYDAGFEGAVSLNRQERESLVDGFTAVCFDAVRPDQRQVTWLVLELDDGIGLPLMSIVWDSSQVLLFHGVSISLPARMKKQPESVVSR